MKILNLKTKKKTYLSYKHAESNWDCDNAKLYLPSVGGSIKRNEATLPNITTDPFYKQINNENKFKGRTIFLVISTKIK